MMDNVNVKVKKVVPSAIMPTRASAGSVCYDLYIVLDYVNGTQYVMPDGKRHTFRTGLAFEIPEGYEGVIRTRSSSWRNGWEVLPGTIDSDYRGEVSIIAANQLGEKHIRHGDRIAQLAIRKVPNVIFEEVEALSETHRGEGGFGSTGR